MSEIHDTHGHGPPPGEAPGFLDKPENVKLLLRIFYALCAVLVVADFFVHRHIVHPWEHLPAFYPIFGWLSIVLLVVVAKQLRKVVKREEDYYDV